MTLEGTRFLTLHSSVSVVIVVIRQYDSINLKFYISDNRNISVMNDKYYLFKIKNSYVLVNKTKEVLRNCGSLGRDSA